jgi:hypothetical protein
MQIKGNVIQNQSALSPAHVWETAKGWARAYMTYETMFDAALTLATFGSAGFVLLSLQKIVTNWTVPGF